MPITGASGITQIIHSIKELVVSNDDVHQQDVTHQHLQLLSQSLWLLVVETQLVQVAVGGSVVVVSCHPLPTSNVPVTIQIGCLILVIINVSACNYSDTVLVQTTPITAKGGG